MRQAAEHRVDSQANGALMRVSPLGVFGWQLESAELARLAIAEAGLTHANPVCRAASAAYSIAIATGIRTGDRTAAFDSARDWLAASGEKKLLDVIDKSRQQPPADFSFHAGWVLIAFQNAFYHLLNTDSLAQALSTTAAAGGDTDTNAAIAGALLGAVAGRDAIPAQWRRMVLSCRPAEGLANVHRPRPAAVWPVDVLELAELLLLAGNQARGET
jgi:ADP-ribosylglycohydrolase